MLRFYAKMDFDHFLKTFLKTSYSLVALTSCGLLIGFGAVNQKNYFLGISIYLRLFSYSYPLSVGLTIILNVCASSMDGLTKVLTVFLDIDNIIANTSTVCGLQFTITTQLSFFQK